MATLIVKATFSLAHDGPAPLADVQEPLELDQRSDLGDGELRRCSDFAPRKVGTDVVLVGHAHAAQPERVLPFSFTIGPLHRDLVAVTDAPAARVPLLRRFVRERAGDPASARSLAPRPGQAIGGDGGHGSPSVDFSEHNCAPPEQRLESLEPRTRITLRGLLPNAAVRSVEIPTVEPCLFFAADRRGEPMPAGQRVVLRCDTVWIDTDRALCCLTWRGLVTRAPNPEALPVAVVALGPPGGPVQWSELAGQLQQAQWSRAVTADDLPPRPMHRYGAAASAEAGQAHSPPPEATAVYAGRRPPSEGALLELDEPETDRTMRLDPDAAETATRAQLPLPQPVPQEPSASDADGDPPGVDDEEEPAPVTPRAGMQLGQAAGFALGASTLGAQASQKPLPFGGSAEEAELPKAVAAVMAKLASSPGDGRSTVAMEAIPTDAALPMS
ncbi:MAG: DUF2169 domain-containing protein, partial [Deltaproteobacteria bacterium]|nr:DUF2169 domain-containing protein [Deltaproteobacteria bacterium]